MGGDKAVTATFSLLLGLTDPALATPAQWTTRLDVPGAAGNVTVDGASTAGVGRAQAMIEVGEHRAGVRVSGVLATASGPGTWRFERQAGAGPPVRLKVLEG